MRKLSLLTCSTCLFLAGHLLSTAGQTNAAPPQATTIPTPGSTAAATSAVPTGFPVINVDNAAKLKPIARLGRGALGQVYWSPDNQALAVTSSIGVWLYTADQLDASPRLLPAPIQCTVGAFSPDGTLFAASAIDGTVRVWNVQTGAQQLSLSTDADTAFYSNANRQFACHSPVGVAWSPDGKTLATGGVQSVILWNAQTGKQTTTLNFSGGAWLIAFSPDGKWMAASNGSNYEGFTLGVWDVKSHVLRKTWTEVLGPAPTMLTFNRDSATLFYSTNALLQWPVKGTTPPRAVVSTSVGSSLAFDPDLSLFAFGDEDGLLHVWNVKKGAQQMSFRAHSSAMASLAWSPDGTRLASAGYDDVVHVWDMSTQQLLGTLAGYAWKIANARFSPDGQTLAVGAVTGANGESTRVELWNARTGELVSALSAPTSYRREVSHLQFSPDGSLLAINSQVWSVKSGQPDARLASMFVAFSPDGKQLAVVPEPDCNALKIVDASTLAERHSIPINGCPDDLLFSPDSSHLAGNGGHLIDLTSGTISTIEQASCCDFAVAFSPDSQTIAFGGAGHIDLWDVKTGSQKLTIAVQGYELSDLQFTHDGKVLLSPGTNDDNVIDLWNVATGSHLKALPPLAGPINAIDLSPDGTLLAAAVDDGTVILWGAQ